MADQNGKASEYVGKILSEKRKVNIPAPHWALGEILNIQDRSSNLQNCIFFWLAGQEAAHGKDEESKNQRQLKRTQVSGAGCFKQGCKYWIVKFVLVSGTSSWMYWLVVTCRGFLQVLFLLSQVSRYSKMEKADVLEMAVQHLRELKRMEKKQRGKGKPVPK